MKTYSIVGMNWQKTEALVAALGVGTAVTLVREPQNPADPNAVAVWVDGTKVGYVPKKTNAALAQFIDQTGRDFGVDVMAMDGVKIVQSKAIDGTFFRSPNSGYPQVSVDD